MLVTSYVLHGSTLNMLLAIPPILLCKSKRVKYISICILQMCIKIAEHHLLNMLDTPKSAYDTKQQLIRNICF